MAHKYAAWIAGLTGFAVAGGIMLFQIIFP